MPISAIIPSAGTLDEHGNARLGRALDAAALADEIVVVITNDRMTDEGAGVIRAAGVRTVHVDSDPFNYSRAINVGVAVSTGDTLLLLNDDIALTRTGTPDWLTTLAEKKGDVKGVMLVQPNEEIVEHAGVVFSAPGGMPCHAGQYMPVTEPGRANFKDGPQGAVTGAVQMVTRRMFNRAGGYDEGFSLNYNDIDFCLRVQERGGKVMIYNSIRLVHNESSTRGWSMPTEEDFMRLAKQHRTILRTHHVVIDEFAARRFRRQIIEQRQQEGLPV